MIGMAHRVRRGAARVPAAFSVLAVVVAAAATGSAALAAPDSRTSPSVSIPTTTTVCTMALPNLRATVETQMTDAADFCEIASKALASDVFRSSVVVMPGRLWHYADSALSCQLRYRHSSSRITIRNSPPVCGWLTAATGWRRVAGSLPG